MTRIIAGSARGRRLSVPPGARPTTDRIRESLFSALDHQLGGFAGLRVLDLYAGSGALGLEAASRGATRVVLVEAHARAVAVIRQNAAAVGMPGIQVIGGTVAAHLGGVPEEFDLVLADPPYDLPTGQLTRVLAGLPHGWLAASAVVVVERATHADALVWPAGIVALRKIAFGTTTLWYGLAVRSRGES